MSLPRGLVGKASVLIEQERCDDSFGRLMLNQIGRCSRVDHVVGVTGAQQVEKIEPAFGGPGGDQAKRSLPMCVVYSSCPTWRAAVSSTVSQAAVSRPASRRASFSVWNASLWGCQHRQDFAFRDPQAKSSQLAEQAFDRHLPLKVLHQHMSAQPLAAVAPQQRYDSVELFIDRDGVVPSKPRTHFGEAPGPALDGPNKRMLSTPRGSGFRIRSYQQTSE